MSESDIQTIKDQLALIEEIYQKDRRIAELEAEVERLKHPWTKTSVTIEVHQNNAITFEEGEG